MTPKIRKMLVECMLLLAVCALCGCTISIPRHAELPASGQDFAASGDVRQIPVIGPLIQKLLGQWWGIPALIIGGILVCTKLLKMDLSKSVLPMVIKLATWMLTAPAPKPILMQVAPAAQPVEGIKSVQVASTNAPPPK